MKLVNNITQGKENSKSKTIEIVLYLITQKILQIKINQITTLLISHF